MLELMNIFIGDSHVEMSAIYGSILIYFTEMCVAGYFKLKKK